MGKVILITGASRGIGAATALLAAEKGYTVCINYLKSEKEARTVAEKINERGGTVEIFRADVSREEEVVNLFNAIDKQFGQLHGLVNNAGILETQMRLGDMRLDRIERIFKHNFISCFLCCKEAIRRMSTKLGGKGGAIVNVSSIAARTGSPNEYIDYASSKGAVDTLTVGLSKELASEGIRVNAVRPGFIYTDIHASGGEPGRVDRLKAVVPLRRGGHPEEVAEAIVWLLSSEPGFITGSFIDVAGGV